MDRQDAKPSRPSLLAGEQTHPAAQPASARILADMQDRESGPQRAAGKARTRWLPMVVLLLAVVAMGWWWQSPPADGAATEATPVPTADAGASYLSRDTATGGAATIIDEALPASMATTSGRATSDGTGDAGVADPAINPMVKMAQPGSAPAGGATTDGTSNPFLLATATATPTTTTPAVPRPPARKPEGASGRDEPDLLAILMGNIKPGQPTGDSPGSGLDAFLQTMDADSTGVASAERNRNGRPQRTRSQQIQQNLRECPAANTAKGLKCRQEICAVYAGRDPACPAAG